MHASERNRIMNELRRLVLAQSDLAQAAAAATALMNEHLNGDLCRALETAIVVCYVRPFTRANNIKPLGEQWYPELPSARALHDLLMAMRDQVYAHNDRTEFRDIIDSGASVGMPGIYSEQWVPINREALPGMIQMFSDQQLRMRTRSQELQQKLRDD